MVNIKVAVRIRPLSERELLHGEEIIVRKENKSVLVTNPKIPERQDGDSRQRTRRFTVDFCYDSGDPEGSTQEEVYKEIGSEVLHSMYEGYNACVLAYGHSASGKTYTIMGLQSDPGLTPRLCEGLFDKLKVECPEGRIRVQVVISFLEIYNEKVRDLLGGEETGATCGNFSLRVREHPKLGPYVQGLSQHSVADKRKLLQLLTTGNRRRSTAATESNIHSSRSHAVFTIQFKQSDGENFETEKSSKVHLVDLAGSERARSSQSKARLQEGANINKSLATLGNVICALAESYDSGVLSKEHSSPKTWQPFVPYRDSVLTWLLKDTLGGNSNTIMIATISPARSCISETVNTLRYAKRAKKIVNQPIVNEDPKIRTIRELRKEIARLKGLLIFFRSCGRVDDPWEGGIAAGFPRPESKWLEPEGTLITIKEGDYCKKEIQQEKGADKEEEDKREDSRRSKSPSECTGGVRDAGAAFSGGDAREINDEKKSDVNGSVNDNFSHETQFFSDSLESFSSLFRKSGNSCDGDDDGSGQADAGEDEFEKRASDCLHLTAEFGSHENLSKKTSPQMLHRSRPDLIKGISTRTKENGLPSGSSHSCTDVSNLSHSTSENSLNSSGSAEVQPSESRPTHNTRPCLLASAGARAEARERGTRKSTARNEALGADSKKKEKGVEAVDAVTSRLYTAKKKPETVKKEENEDDFGELEEIKLCKRARMKLFDLSRKLAMSRKIKKTVDSNTQTDCTTGTLRVKEKCVTTDPSSFETTSEESSKEEKKPYVIMNQVFIPRASNYVVECGEVVRVEGPEVLARHESATQTCSEDGRYKNADTSPVGFSPREEDCFSEDSLDLETKNPNRRPGEDTVRDDKVVPETRLTFNWPPNFEICLSRSFEKPSKEGSQKTKSEKPGGILCNGLSVPVFTLEGGIDLGDRMDFFITGPSSGIFESKKVENMSSDSFTSTEGTENNSLSETSSEDFVFYENPKDKGKTTGDRELYTITENSEQSDLSDAFSPVQRPSFRASEAQEWSGDPGDRYSLGKKDRDEVRVTQTTSSDKKKTNELKGRISAEQSDNVLRRIVHGTAHTTQDRLKIPKSSSSSATDTTNLQNTKTFRFPENVGNETDRSCSSDAEGRTKLTNRMDFQFNSQKQYLNLNISSSSNSSRLPPFSVDTHLFGKPSKKDQSTDAMSTSADSITFVFMGPAKPKTSVLMEIIGRSLGRNSLSSEIPLERKSRSRGVQCDASLMRSVSVDTAMMALSRIARNQGTFPEIQRTTSLGKLNADEMIAMLGGGKLRSYQGSSCQCQLETGNLKEEKRVLKCSVGTNTASDRLEVNDTGKNKTAEAEKPKKTVSWFGETQKVKWSRNVSVESEEPNFELQHRDFPETEVDLKSSPITAEPEPPERRVRFVKPEPSDFEEFGQMREQGDTLTALLREATQLLKNINSRSSKQNIFSEERAEEFEINRKNEENRKGGFKMFRKADAVLKTRAEGCSETGWRWKPMDRKSDESQINLTWPRRRPTTGKPPTGTKPKFPRSPLPSRLELHSNAFPTSNLRSWSQSSRLGSNAQSWNLSNLSVALSNSYLGEGENRPPSSRSSYEASVHKDYFHSPRVASPKRISDTRSTIGSISDLETDLEECCRRLEMATEQDRMREEIQERRKTVFEYRRNDDSFCIPSEEAVREHDAKTKKPREVVKRRKTEGCVGSCVCGTSGGEPCKHLWFRGCRSSFELDSFGPGSTHCHELCMFCRKKEAEIYYSAVNLNSECSSGLCRLNYYGYCPCSPVKLNQVVFSPRAYMQRLLALRKQIVSNTKHMQLSREDTQHKNFCSSPWRSRFSLSGGQNFL